MSEQTAEPRVAHVRFTGARGELAGIMLGGYALMVPTLGLYRFWQATAKRRFYWQNTVIDGEPLEYTGRATQLLFGFLMALALFVPIYMGLFYVSMQETQYLAAAYGVLAALLVFFRGYGVYRARDFRLSRTLWRGIRFDQKGNAWLYALRQFIWLILLGLTGGLIYPWMAASQWRYRWNHTWFGDRRFAMNARGWLLAGPFFTAYALNVVAVCLATFVVAAPGDVLSINGVRVPGLSWIGAAGLCVLVLALTLAWFRAVSHSRLLSTVTLGEAKLKVKLRTLPLLWQYGGFALALVVASVVLALLALAVIGGLLVASGVSLEVGAEGLAQAFPSGTANVVALVVAYLVVLGLFGLLWELIIGLGWWRLMAHAARIENIDSVATVKATGEDASLLGQGLADALNVGAY